MLSSNNPDSPKPATVDAPQRDSMPPPVPNEPRGEHPPPRLPPSPSPSPSPAPLLAADIEDAPFWKEVVAYARLTPRELEPYEGKFIAVYQGNIVDSDFDEAELALRFYRAFGYVPVYIHAVGVEDDVIDVLD